MRAAVDRKTGSAASSRLPPALQAACLALFVLLPTLPALQNSFINLDDSLYVGSRPMADGLTPAGVAFAFTSVTRLYWHPLTWLSHELDAELYGMNSAGPHFTSLLLHALSAGLLFLVLRRLAAGLWTAAVAVLLWALHPLRVESFAWVAERKDVLCALFFIATILAYLRAADCPSPARYLAWNGLGALALMSKPAAVSLVPVLLLLDYWPLRRTAGIPRLIKEKLPLLAMTAAVMFLTVYGQQRSGSTSHLAGVPFWIRLENAPIFLVRYLGKVLWPVNLACFYPYDKHPAALSVAGSALLLSAITFLAFRQRKRWPWLLVAWLWFLVALLPNIGLLQAGRQSIADRFTHLAMIGIAVAVAAANPFRNRTAAVSACAALVVLTCLTWRQIGYWHDSYRLFEHAISVEDNDYMRGVLAVTLIQDHRDAEAEPQLLAALRLAPDSAEHHNNLANILLRTDRLDRAAAEARTAQRLAPDDISVAETMAVILLHQADYRGAIAEFDHAVRLGAPSAPVATELSDMGASVASRGRAREAEPLIRKAVELNPLLVQARRNLVLVLDDQHRPDEARAALAAAIQATGRQPQYEDLER
jgi:Flp pilus assembly protein TadD